ncbi:hypothetical protein FKM82_013366 [Ascaphus truei]
MYCCFDSHFHSPTLCLFPSMYQLPFLRFTHSHFFLPPFLPFHPSPLPSLWIATFLFSALDDNLFVSRL